MTRGRLAGGGEFLGGVLGAGGEVLQGGVDAGGRADAVELQAHLYAGERAGEHQFVDAAEVADAKHFAFELAETRTERHVEALENRRPHVVGVDAVGHEDRRQRVRVFARIRATISSPRPHRTPRRLGEPRVTRERVREAFFA